VNKKNSFGKVERIKSKKVISALFDRNSPDNNSFLVYPFKVIFSSETIDPSASFLPQVLISVSKRKFKNATDRNKIKRLTKEAYRLNKLSLQSPVSLALIYVANDIMGFVPIEKAMKGVLVRLKKETS
jgi:ribonuclease P protein component